MKTVVNFRCYQCEEEFPFSVDLDDKPRLSLTCPYCGVNCVADFEPHRKPSVTVMRNGEAVEQAVFELPEVVMLREPKPER